MICTIKYSHLRVWYKMFSCKRTNKAIMIFSSSNFQPGVLKKYSNFVGHPVYLNKEQVNELQPLWLLDPKNITKEQYDEFYRFIANTYMKPRFTLHYKVSCWTNLKFEFSQYSNVCLYFSRNFDLNEEAMTTKIFTA